MIVDTNNVFESLLKDPSLLKCVGIERIIQGYEFAQRRMSGEDVKKSEERWLLNSIAKGLIEHNFVKFETEWMEDGNVKVSCLIYAVDPKADNQQNS